MDEFWAERNWTLGSDCTQFITSRQPAGNSQVFWVRERFWQTQPTQPVWLDSNLSTTPWTGQNKTPRTPLWLIAATSEVDPNNKGTACGFATIVPSLGPSFSSKQDPDGPFHAKTLEWPQRLYDDVHGKNEPDDEDWVDAENWKRWDFQFSKREPFMLKADWHLGMPWNTLDGWEGRLKLAWYGTAAFRSSNLEV